MVTWEPAKTGDISKRILYIRSMLICRFVVKHIAVIHFRVFSFYDMFTDQMLFVRYFRVSCFPPLLVTSV